MAVQYRDYYEILGVARSATTDEIRKAYRKLAKKYHPDVSKAKDADARYKEINEAYEVLKDPDKRAKYDTLGANWEQGQDFTPPPGWQGGGMPNAEYGGNFGSFSDFFETLFGGAGRGFGGGGLGDIFGGARGGRSMQRDSRVELTLPLEEVVSGGTHTFVVSGADGSQQTINVKLPRGVVEGSSIRLPGKAPGGGDLHVTIHVKTHPTFEVDGHNLSRSVKVAPWKAVLGGTVSVATLDGSVNMKIPPGTQSSQRMRLKGKGLPKRAAGESGDMFVRIEIDIPKKLTDRQKELWEELAELEPSA